MTKRQEKLLQAIVKEYVRSSKPVSSKVLAQKYKLGLSSATIRNEMKELQALGYLKKPHTSAGRIPTEKGYRLFIKSLENREVEVSVRKPPAFAKAMGGKKSSEDIFKHMTKTLAEMSGGLAFGGIKEMKSFYQSGLANLLKEPEWDDKDYFSEMAKMMEEFDKHFDEMFKQVTEHQTKVFIGKENPLRRTKKLTLIISGCKMPKKKHGVIGLLGPMRMRYDYNISLINKLREMLENYE